MTLIVTKTNKGKKAKIPSKYTRTVLNIGAKIPALFKNSVKLFDKFSNTSIIITT